MFVPWAALNRLQPITALCTWGIERKKSILAEEEAREGEAQDFTGYGRPLVIVSSFCYLGKDANSDRRQLNSGGWEPPKGPPTIGATGKDHWEGRDGCT